MTKNKNGSKDHMNAVSRLNSMRLQDQKERADEQADNGGGKASLEEYRFFDADSIRAERRSLSCWVRIISLPRFAMLQLMIATIENISHFGR